MAHSVINQRTGARRRQMALLSLVIIGSDNGLFSTKPQSETMLAYNQAHISIKFYLTVNIFTQ